MASERARPSRPGHALRAAAAVGAATRAERRERDATGEHARRLSAIREALSSRDAGKLDPSTQALLLRKLAIARFEAGRYADALEIAQRMVASGAHLELGHHEAARAHAALGEHQRAAESDRLAARAADADQRAFFWWSSATHLEHAGEVEPALDALRRGLRWANEGTRALLRGHAAAIQLGRGQAVRQVSTLLAELGASSHRDGYGRYLMGRIAHELGDRTAAAHLRAFLRRHASSDAATRKTLEWELRDAERRLHRLGPTAV